jgi:hypothetical protein
MVTVAPIIEFEYYKKGLIASKGHVSAMDSLREIKANKVFETLWLPPVGQFTSGAVVLLSPLAFNPRQLQSLQLSPLLLLFFFYAKRMQFMLTVLSL